MRSAFLSSVLLSGVVFVGCANPAPSTEMPVSSDGSEGIAHVGLAASVCPSGPFSRPIQGTLNAEIVDNTEPTSLDPNDTEFHLYEGAVWLNSALYFSDFRTSSGFPSRILKYSPGQPLSIVLDDSGTNGLALDAQGTLLLGARHSSKSVVRFNADLSEATDLAASFEGKHFNSPNDVAMRSDGHFYFTDPDFQAGGQKELDATSVYWVTPGGAVSAVDSTFKNPNGISISPDEKFLFVAGNEAQGYVKRYPLAKDGSVGEGTIVLSNVSVPDGMAFDCAGNLYVTQHSNRTIIVITMDGEELGRISGFNKNITNLAFGGAERKTLFVTMTGGLAKIELPVPGLPY